MQTSEITNKKFTVVAVSENTNSFGLYGMILLSKDGTAFEVAANSLNVKNKGEELLVPHQKKEQSYQFYTLGFEIPRELEKMDPKQAKKFIREAKENA